ncbi:TetR/AcrR family transcriptional regulator [Microbacterium sp. Marseille-Q6965]|uniref:TetR/AcrR family transcriptional regulator n=1 Tax=Microbacterium sp. Marseille-Q6965 TaxID=2965072 RepID=UPI0021B6F99A|nr:TetR/AcrR family transcriptional regulator [Microbacterium sp. Marseille-Q6965]
MSTSGSRYHHGDLAAALLDAADALLSERGANALSLREVARRAGVSHNAPYHHFADRKALMNGLAQRHLRRMLEAEREAVEAEAAPDARVRALGLAYVRYAQRHPHGFAIVFDPEICDPAAPTEAMAPLIRANEELLADAVAGIAPDMAESERRHAESGFWALVHGLAQLSVAGHIPPDAAVAFDALVAVIRTPPARR